MMLHPSQVIRRPLLTEKGTGMAEGENKVLFEVALDANKVQVKRAVEQLYEVTVLNVRTQIVPGKIVRRGRSSGRRPKWKKAIVKLDEGSSIDFFATA